MRPRTGFLPAPLLILATLAVLMMMPAATPAEEEPDATAVTVIEQSVMQGVDWLQRRRTFSIDGVPYGVTGMPIVFYSGGAGFHYGGWLEVADYGERPYRYRANVQWWLTTAGKRDHHMRVEIPSFLWDRLAIRVMTRDLKDIGTSFFGIGNDSEILRDELDREPDYYLYHLEQQRSSLDMEANLVGPLAFFAGTRFNRGLPSRVHESRQNAYYVFNNAFLGVDAGWSNFVAAGLILDTRDDQEVTSSGVHHRAVVSEVLLVAGVGLRLQPLDAPFTRTTCPFASSATGRATSGSTECFWRI